MPHLRARTNTFSAAFRVRSEAAFALHDFFHKNGFVYVHTPLITGSDCEGAGEMFGVTTIDPEDPPRDADGKVDYGSDFFGRQTNLTVSGQLEAEGMALAFGKVYTFGPTFRAENSNTPRHAAEFWMIEPEMAFADLTDYMDNAEAMIKSVVRHLLASCPDEMAFFNQFYDKGLLERLNALAGSEFARVSYTDAVKILQENNDRFEYKVKRGHRPADRARALPHRAGVQAAGLRHRLPQGDQELLHASERRRQDRGRGRYAGAGRGELCGGSQREERLDRLEARMDELGMKKDDYQWYLDLRRFGSAKHAGYGLGFERLIMYVTGIPNIRDVLPFPRTAGGF